MKKILIPTLLAALLSTATLFAQTDATSAAKSGRTSSSALVPAIRTGMTNWMARHEGFVKETKKGGVDILFIGDSITDMWRDEMQGKS